MSDQDKTKTALEVLAAAGPFLAVAWKVVESAIAAARAGDEKAAEILRGAAGWLLVAEADLRSNFAKNDAAVDEAARRTAGGDVLVGGGDFTTTQHGLALRVQGLESSVRGIMATVDRLDAGTLASLTARTNALDSFYGALRVVVDRVLDRVAALEALAGLGGPQPPDVVAGPYAGAASTFPTLPNGQPAAPEAPPIAPVVPAPMPPVAPATPATPEAPPIAPVALEAPPVVPVTPADAGGGTG